MEYLLLTGKYFLGGFWFFYCNVIGNRCGIDVNQVLFRCDVRIVNADHCIFLNNTAKYMFGGYDLTISDSYVDTNSIDTYRTVKFEKLTENYDLNDFSHFYTEISFLEPKVITIETSYLSKFVK